MDVKEYRQSVLEELRKASAAETPARRESLTRGARMSAPAGAGATAEAVSTLQDRNGDPKERALALRRLPIDADDGAQRIDELLAILADRTEAPQVRQAALLGMQRAAFLAPLFAPRRPEFLNILRSMADDPDPGLREDVLDVLASYKDEYAQRRLLEGLEDPAKELVRPGKAIQFLGYDIHAGQFPILRKLAVESPEPEVKHEALRLLAGDPESKTLFTSLLSNRSADPRSRALSVIGLQLLDPSAFEQTAKKIVMDDSEDAGLRATSLGALTHFDDYQTVRQVPEFSRKVHSLQSAPSESLRSAAARYRAKRE